MNINDIRKSYRLKKLSSNDLDANPIIAFKGWFQEALDCQIDEVNAVSLATCNSEGRPSCRLVLLKEISEKGLIFFTNYESRKSQDLAENPNAALTVWWKEIERQVRFEGLVEKCPAAMCEQYFAKRPRRSQLAAWVSQQSRPIASRKQLEEQYLEVEKKFEGKEVPLPPFWGGYILIPHSVEFWQGREDRLHDRILYNKIDGAWSKQRLSP